MVDLKSFELDGVRFVQDTRDGKDRGQSEGNSFILVKSDAYLDFYRSLVDRAPKHILEIGMFEGGSMVFFDKIYRPEKLVGVDLRPPIPALDEYAADKPHIKTFYRLSQDAPNLATLLAEHFPGGADLIVDDASHLYEQSRKTFHLTFPLLKPGGTYVLEDWAWSHGQAAQQGDHFWAGREALTNLVIELLLHIPLGQIGRLEVRQGFVVLEKAKLARGAINLEDIHTRLRGRALPRL